ncbi:hypothetical protein BDZ85DRAFT_259680 [Elsinoe ampelina]|uniref:Uncharacterized protein n=1 Tax=Elsinoe ampelina TaxID=302913 RepID=A0A6A6GHM9_9PEZI|nr:hypothetical protein BDZ85DRAFT_259680 [Elsinoe ampelina]
MEEAHMSMWRRSGSGQILARSAVLRVPSLSTAHLPLATSSMIVVSRTCAQNSSRHTSGVQTIDIRPADQPKLVESRSALLAPGLVSLRLPQ